MKKIIAIITVLVMCMSTVGVYADTTEEKFLDALSTQIYEGNVKVEVSMAASGTFLDNMGEDGELIKSLLDSSLVYDINAVSNEENTVMAADGNLSFVSGAEEIIPSFGMDLWLNMDISDEENMQYYIIMKFLGEYLEQATEDQYLLFDYMKIPEFETIMNSMIEMGVLGNGEIAADTTEIIEGYTLSELNAAIFDGIDFKPEYSNGKYTLTMGDAEIKKMIATVFSNALDMTAELTGEDGLAEEADEVKAEIAELLAPLANVQLFDDKKGMVIELLVDQNNDCTAIHVEVNLDINIYDIAKAFDPTMPVDEGYTKEDYGFTFSVAADMQVLPLAEGYEVNFPKLDNRNTVDMFAASQEAVSYGIIGADDNIQILYNGEAQALQNKPVIVYDRTFVPFRELANMFGVGDEDIFYDEATEKVYLKSGDIEIEMYIGSTAAYVNGDMSILDVPVFTYNDRTYIPVRFVAEMFGKTVGYEQTETLQTITVND